MRNESIGQGKIFHFDGLRRPFKRKCRFHFIEEVIRGCLVSLVCGGWGAVICCGFGVRGSEVDGGREEPEKDGRFLESRKMVMRRILFLMHYPELRMQEGFVGLQEFSIIF